MKILYTVAALLTLVGTYSPHSAQAAAASVKMPSIRSGHFIPRMYFQPNRGQCDADIEYVAHVSQSNLYLYRGTVEYAASRIRTGSISISLAGGKQKPESVGSDKQAGPNSYLGIFGRRDIVGVPGYGRVQYRAVYPGIDVSYYFHDGNVENDFELAPGAKPDLVRMHVAGGIHLQADGKGNLRSTTGGPFMWRRPAAYQFVDGARKAVACSYHVLGASDAGFNLGKFDLTKPLIIDPIISFNPPPTMDAERGIATDASGNVYTVGQTFMIDPAKRKQMPLSVGIIDEYSPSGNLIYETQIGGVQLGSGSTGADNGHGLIVDAAGNAFVAGVANAGFPCTPNAFRTTTTTDPVSMYPLAPCILEIGAGGGRVVYASFIGDSNWRSAITGLAFGPANRLYLVGNTGMPDFPTTPGALARKMPGSDFANYAFLMVLDPTKSGDDALVYSSYISGTTGLNAPNAIAVDAEGCAYVCGSETSGDFPTTPGAYTPKRNNGGMRAWLIKVDPSRSGAASLIYGTFVQGTGVPDTEGFTVAIDSANCAYLVGYSLGQIQTTPGCAQPNFGGGGTDGWIAKFNPAGTALIWATHLGGSDQDYLRGLTLDANNNVYVFGHTRSRDYPLTPDALQDSSGAAVDSAVLSVLSPDGSRLLFSTYLHDGEYDYGRSIALDPAGNIYVAGSSKTPFLLKLYRTPQ